MNIPDYQTLMLPLLKAVADRNEHKISNLYEALSNEFALSEEERELRLPSGRDTYIKNRVAWAKTYLKKAGLVSSPHKGIVVITDDGVRILQQNPSKIDNVYLRQFDSFKEFRPRNGDKLEFEDNPISNLSLIQDIDNSLPPNIETPEENFDRSYQDLREELASEVLDIVKQSSPYFFEKLVVDLMLAMGYGGSRKDAGETTRRSADGGVDGTIKLDRLGLDTICLQAKRYTTESVTEPQVRDFAGALQGYRAKKGVFITTSQFTSSATDFANKIENKIVLIDGYRLSLLMIDFGVGVSTTQVYEIKQVDTDYFIDN